MTVRELSSAQARLMDHLAADPDASNAELAARLGWSLSYVEQLFHGVFAVYQRQTRTGALMEHVRRRGKRRVRREAQAETLGLT